MLGSCSLCMALSQKEKTRFCTCRAKKDSQISSLFISYSKGLCKEVAPAGSTGGLKLFLKNSSEKLMFGSITKGRMKEPGRIKAFLHHWVSQVPTLAAVSLRSSQLSSDPISPAAQPGCASFSTKNQTQRPFVLWLCNTNRPLCKDNCALAHPPWALLAPETLSWHGASQKEM